MNFTDNELFNLAWDADKCQKDKDYKPTGCMDFKIVQSGIEMAVVIAKYADNTGVVIYPQTLKAAPSVDWWRNIVSWESIDVSFKNRTVQMGKGFASEFQALRQQVPSEIDKLGISTFQIASYSQGSAIALGGCIDLFEIFGTRLNKARLFACPRGLKKDGIDYLELISNNFDFKVIDHVSDRIPGLPFEWMGFSDPPKISWVGKDRFNPNWFWAHFPEEYDKDTK